MSSSMISFVHDLAPWQGWLEAGLNWACTFPLWHDSFTQQPHVLESEVEAVWSFMTSLGSHI